jgi:hypothetical protein
VQDISDGPITPHAPVWGAGRPEQQLATLAVRLEMTAVYLRLVRGQVECTCHAERYGPTHGFADRTCRVHRRTQSHSAPRKLSCGWARTLAIPPGRVTDGGDQFLLDTLRRRPERTAGSDRPWSLRRHTALLDEGVDGRLTAVPAGAPERAARGGRIRPRRADPDGNASGRVPGRTRPTPLLPHFTSTNNAVCTVTSTPQIHWNRASFASDRAVQAPLHSPQFATATRRTQGKDRTWPLWTSSRRRPLRARC